MNFLKDKIAEKNPQMALDSRFANLESRFNLRPCRKKMTRLDYSNKKLLKLGERTT